MVEWASSCGCVSSLHYPQQPISRELRELPRLAFYEPPEPAPQPEGGMDEAGTEDTDTSTSGTAPDTPTSPPDSTPTTDKPHPLEAARYVGVFTVLDGASMALRTAG